MTTSTPAKGHQHGGGSLVTVRAALSHCTSPHVGLFTSLIDSKKISSAKTENETILKIWGDGIPRVDKKLSPFLQGSIPEGIELRAMLMRDFQEQRHEGTVRVSYVGDTESDEEGDGVGEGGPSRQDGGEMDVEISDSTDKEANTTAGEGQDVPIIIEEDGEADTDADETVVDTVEKNDDDEIPHQKDIVNLIIYTAPQHSARTYPGHIASLSCLTLAELSSAFMEMLPLSTLLNHPFLWCSILPCNAFLPLQHNNETTTCSTLLSGSLVYIIWPPTPTNHALLADAYKKFAGSKVPKELRAVTDALEGGVAVIQCPGEAIQVPPYCLMITLALEVSVLASYQTCPATSFLSICEKIPFLEAYYPTEANGEAKRAGFSTALGISMKAIMNLRFDSYKDKGMKHDLSTPGPFLDLVRNWDRIKKDVTSVLHEEDADVIKARWIKLLTKILGKKCLLCGEVVDPKSTGMAPHFENVHWV